MNSSGGYSPQSGTFHLKKEPYAISCQFLNYSLSECASASIDANKKRALANLRPRSVFLDSSVANRIYYSTSFCSHAEQGHNRECIYLINEYFFEA